MALPTKPDMSHVWASGGAKVAPSNTKIDTGWTAEVPPFQWENWSQNRQDAFLDHINKSGFPVWDGLTNYEAAGQSLTKGSDGKIYKSVAASGPSTTVQDPVTDATDIYWTIAFADVGAFLTQTTADARYLRIANNLSDLNNPTTARTNLGVYSIAQADAAIAAKAVGIQYLLVQDQKSSGTGGGTPAAANTFNTRTLNTTIANTITGATLVANQISLPAGTYRFSGICAAAVSGFAKAYIYNVTDATYVAVGLSLNTTGPGAADPITGTCTVRGRVVIASTKVFELRQFLNTSNTNGFGDPVGDGRNEMYAELEIIKEA